MGEPDGNCAPRWEWRTFGAGLPEIEAKLGLTARVAPRRSDEIYLLNSATPHSARFAAACLRSSGYYRSTSTGSSSDSAFKEHFPLSAPMLRCAFAALDLDPSQHGERSMI